MNIPSGGAAVGGALPVRMLMPAMIGSAVGAAAGRAARIPVHAVPVQGPYASLPSTEVKYASGGRSGADAATQARLKKIQEEYEIARNAAASCGLDQQCTNAAYKVKNALQGKLQETVATQWRWPGTLFEHSAVVVYPKGGNPEEGMVYDQWTGAWWYPSGTVYPKTVRPGGYEYKGADWEAYAPKTTADSFSEMRAFIAPGLRGLGKYNETTGEEEPDVPVSQPASGGGRRLYVSPVTGAAQGGSRGARIPVHGVAVASPYGVASGGQVRYATGGSTGGPSVAEQTQIQALQAQQVLPGTPVALPVPAGFYPPFVENLFTQALQPAVAPVQSEVDYWRSVAAPVQQEYEAQIRTDQEAQEQVRREQANEAAYWKSMADQMQRAYEDQEQQDRYVQHQIDAQRGEEASAVRDLEQHTFKLPDGSMVSYSSDQYEKMQQLAAAGKLDPELGVALGLRVPESLLVAQFRAEAALPASRATASVSDTDTGDIVRKSQDTRSFSEKLSVGWSSAMEQLTDKFSKMGKEIVDEMTPEQKARLLIMAAGNLETAAPIMKIVNQPRLTEAVDKIKAKLYTGTLLNVNVAGKTAEEMSNAEYQAVSGKINEVISFLQAQGAVQGQPISAVVEQATAPYKELIKSQVLQSLDSYAPLGDRYMAAKQAIEYYNQALQEGIAAGIQEHQQARESIVQTAVKPTVFDAMQALRAPVQTQEQTWVLPPATGMISPREPEQTALFSPTEQKITQEVKQSASVPTVFAPNENEFGILLPPPRDAVPVRVLAPVPAPVSAPAAVPNAGWQRVILDSKPMLLSPDGTQFVPDTGQSQAVQAQMRIPDLNQGAGNIVRWEQHCDQFGCRVTPVYATGGSVFDAFRR